MGQSLHFYKYQGTGNDFVMVDDRNLTFPHRNTALVRWLCDRRFGVGADGLILLQHDAEADFRMVYYNSDGNLSSMCGNGGRCIARFARDLGLVESQCTFRAVDGMHQATIQENSVSLHMQDVQDVEQSDGYYYLNTGSPHVVKYVDEVSEYPVFKEGRAIRNNQRFEQEGTNVNFVVSTPEVLNIRTYERGVEDETLSCGTGVTASALVEAIHRHLPAGHHHIQVKAMGGHLSVSFHYNGHHHFTSVYLNGPAQKVYEGQIMLP